MVSVWRNLVRLVMKYIEVHHQILWVYLQNGVHYVSSSLDLTQLLLTPAQASVIWPPGYGNAILHGLPASAFPSHTPCLQLLCPSGQLHLVPLAF